MLVSYTSQRSVAATCGSRQAQDRRVAPSIFGDQWSSPSSEEEGLDLSCWSLVWTDLLTKRCPIWHAHNTLLFNHQRRGDKLEKRSLCNLGAVQKKRSLFSMVIQKHTKPSRSNKVSKRLPSYFTRPIQKKRFQSSQFAGLRQKVQVSHQELNLFSSSSPSP